MSCHPLRGLGRLSEENPGGPLRSTPGFMLSPASRAHQNLVPAMSTKRFRIAFSFAGEKRDFVAKVATILAARFGEEKILYDKYHEAEFARRGLGVYLPELYHKNSDLVVLVFCPAYDEKEWTGLEWTAIHDLLKQRKDNEVMLCRFEHAEVTGLYSTAGYMELDGKTPKQTATRILERLAINEGKRKHHYSSIGGVSARTTSTAIPNNLPRLEPFFGRTEELKQIAEALDPEARTWGALIDGPGGMGKTSLAVRAAYDCLPGQFQRIIFLSVKTRELDDDGERELGPFILPRFLEMLNELARELGQPDISKAPENERIRLVLDALVTAKALLILDNLESLTKGDRDQLFTFVRRLPQSCKAILTSRGRIGSIADVLILEALDQTAALETLADLAKRNPLLAKTSEAERRTLFVQTGGKPLLLRWIAGQLGRGSCRTFTDALRFLRRCPPDNDPLEFVFGDLAEKFTTDETKILVAVSYFALPAKVEHIAEVSDIDTGRAGAGLRTLANCSLVVPDQEEKAFALVPMVYDFLRRKWPGAVAETGDQLEQRAYARIEENGYQEYDRFPVLTAAWPTVAPALPLFIAGPNPRLQTVCEALFEFFNFTCRYDESLALHQQAEARAVAAGDLENAGWRAYNAGWIHSLRRQADSVLACAERAEAHWDGSQAGVRELSYVKLLRGHGHRLEANFDAAFIVYRETLGMFRSVSGESEDVAIALNWVGVAEQGGGDFALAERDYRESLRVASVVGYIQGVATATSNLANLAGEREEWAEAEIFARKALQMSEAVGRQELVAYNCRYLAQALLRQGKKAEALPYAQRGVEIYTSFAMPVEIEAAIATVRECEDDG
jgi:tetratricopeptide (TPR) repeat protein